MLLALPACLSTPAEHELANAAFRNVVPKSSPAALVATFRRFCGEDRPVVETAAMLRAGDYVETESGRDAMRRFVVDDRRPAVLLEERAAHRSCGVGAASRTGQAERVARFVPTEFPDAVPADPATFGEGIERAWVRPDGSTVTLHRIAARRGGWASLVGLQIVRPRTGVAS